MREVRENERKKKENETENVVREKMSVIEGEGISKSEKENKRKCVR